ncbi:protein kinase [Streptomyces sp. NPDC003038]|uniref:serine/threonine-protein kinase n=1 Tax=unclassified Streptomyces TaxID=2593676 RepID=UPI0033ABD19C
MGDGGGGGGGGQDAGAESGADRVISGRYRLLDPLGRGGMGIVWRARDEVLAREVAVKEVRAPAGLDPAELERMYRRLEREAWAAARISHRGVVTVYDVATDGGRPWIVMELVRGLSLADVLEAEGPMSPRRAAHIGEQVLAALRSAHESGVLHRDVKPGNVLIGNDGRVVLSDFGIASLEGSSAITMTGEVVGSPEFLAPERALGRDPGPEADLWSLGVMLYAAVEGGSPFRRDTALATLRAVVDEPLPPARRAGPLEPVLEGLLRKDPAERLPAAEAARMLRVVGAGGAVRDSGGPVSGPASGPRSGPDTPAAATRGIRHEPHEPHGPRQPRGARPYGAPTPPVPTSGGPAAPGPAPRGRAGLVLTAGILVLLLALALLAWLLLKDREEAGGGNGGHPTGAPASSRAATTAPSASPSVSPSAMPAQQVAVAVQAVRTAYSGTCPPPAERAPAFTATVEVARTPTVLEYRWTARGGVSSGPSWQSVTLAADGPRSLKLDHTELTHQAGGVFHDAVRLEVRAPAQETSQWVDFSVTCEEETPTSGASSPGATGSPDPTTASPAPSPDESPAGSPDESPAASPAASP